MFTITTNKVEVIDIISGEKKQKALPLTDHWGKKIIKALGFSEGDIPVIRENMRSDRKETTDARRKVMFMAGPSVSVTVWASFKIGFLNEDAAETFIVTIHDIIETKGIDAQAVKELEGYTVQNEVSPIQEPEAVEGEVVGMQNAPAIRAMSDQTGFCRYCNQVRMIKAPVGCSPEDRNDIATKECDCTEAKMARTREAKMEAAGAWAKNVFSQEQGQLQLILCAIRSTYEGSVDYATVKIGKHTHKVDKDSEGMIRIRTTYRDSNEETF